MIRTSIIIPTYKRKESLFRMLESLIPQMTPEMELIVVEQKDKDALTLWPYIKRKKIKAKYIHLLKPSPSRAKNFGVRSARGRFIVFFDDDVLVKPRCIQNLVRALNDPSVGIVGGRVLSKGQPIEKDRSDVGRISHLSNFSDGFSSTITQDVDTVIGCCMGLRRDVFEQMKGFDEQFDGNALREESDLALRIKKMGYRIRFYPKAGVVHMRAETGGARKQDNRLYWFYHYFSNETYFFLKHKPLILFPLFLLTKTTQILRCMFGIGREVNTRSIFTPWRGIGNGIKKYSIYKSQNTSTKSQIVFTL